jgi:insertion element IS1 protein InsB
VALSPEKKRKCWLWVSFDRDSGEVIDFELGSRGVRTGKKLFARIKHIRVSAYYATDNWEPYTDFLPSEKHIKSKKETQALESRNSRVRHFLARFRRKSKCYSKALSSLQASLYLHFFPHYLPALFN